MCYSSSTLTPFLCMLLLATLISQPPVSNADSSSDIVIARLRYKVHIVNGFPDNAKPLLISCHSNDDDLGNHTLWKDQEFRFKFMLDLLRDTHFVCNFAWGSKILNDITVFLNKEESESCKQSANCFWKATPDGIYFSDHLGDWQKKFDW